MVALYADANIVSCGENDCHCWCRPFTSRTRLSPQARSHDTTKHGNLFETQLQCNYNGLLGSVFSYKFLESLLWAWFTT
jgi:hypothetical protein